MEALNFVRNILLKGLNTNVENTRYPSDSAFEILNGRIYSVDGENFVVKNVDGNQFKFALRPGYTLIGAQEYDEILYLVSVNEDDMLEVGSYPSLKKQVPISSYNGYIRYGITDVSGFEGFENEYKPLPSIWRSEEPGLLPQVYGFRTKSFKFTRDNFIMPLIKESYDGTVNIYLNDGENFNRVVNSGFSKKDEEVKLERLYRGDVDNFNSIDKNVDKVTKQFLSINEPSYGKLKEVASGGNLPVGNLFFYIRYLDYEFNKTNFVPLIGPIMITYGDDIFSVSGNHPTGLTNYANKNVTISMEYMDMAYKYFEIAMVWRTGTEQIGLGSRAMLLNKRIPILQTSFDFNITGFEDMAEITEDEVLRPALKETICKVSTSLDGRMFGANWKEFGYNKDAMRELAKKVWVRPELWNRNSLFDIAGDYMQDFDLYSVDIDKPEIIGKKYWYQSPEFVLDRVGYYRGETYPFALVGLKEDGTFTDPYPITGHDYYEDTLRAGAIANFYAGNDLDGSNAGFVRMPQYGTGNANSMIDNMDYLLMARAELGQMWIYLNAHLEDFEGIKGFRIVRGDRFKNLLYHGVNLGMSEATDIYGETLVDHAFGVFRTRERNVISGKMAHSFPTIDAYPIGTYQKDFAIPGSYQTESANYVNYFKCISVKYRKALYSPDILFSNVYSLNSNDICYSYIPYSNYPQWSLNSWSEINRDRYIDYSVDDNEIISNSVYVARFNYLNNKYGRASIDSKLIRGIKSRIEFPLLDEKAYFTNKTMYGLSSDNWVLRIKQLQSNNMSAPLVYPDDYILANKYIKNVATNVPINSYGILNNYSSYFGDGIWDNINVGFTDVRSAASYSNSDVSSAEYLGLEYIDEEDYMFDAWKQSSMFPLLVYKQINDSAYYTNLVNRYLINGIPQLSEINYKLSGVYFDKENTRKYTWNNELKNQNSIYMNGDCFVNRFSFRALHNKKSFDLYVEDDIPQQNANGKHYNRGSLMSIVLQSDSNSSVRGLANQGFWPLWASDWNESTSTLNYNSVLCARFGGNSGLNDEDFIYDWGHSQSLPLNIIPGINDIYQNRNTDYITRVRYTDKHQEVAFIDGWRSMYYLSKADLPVEYGEIFGIGVIGSSLVIATSDSVQQLFVNEKAITQSEQGGNVIVGAGSILYGESKRLSDYGTQHKHILTTDNGVYGYDYKRSIFWKVIASSTTSGSIVLGVKQISSNISSFLIKRRIYDSSIKSIAYGYDEAEHEVLMTVKHKIRLSVNQFSIADNGNITMQLPLNYDNYDWCGYVEVERNGIVSNVSIVDIYENTLTLSSFDISGTIVLILNKGFTLSYNELLSSGENDFITRLGISPDIYSSLKNVVMSLNRDISYDYIYSHDNISEKHTFYGYNSWFKYGIVVTNNNSQSKATFIQAIFYSFIVTSNEEPFDVVDYETEFQKCRHYPFIDTERFWVTPEYAENRWMFTIPETNLGTGQYEADSNMRGIWLKTLFIYKGKNNKYIGEIVNQNVLSFT